MWWGWGVHLASEADTNESLLLLALNMQLQHYQALKHGMLTMANLSE